MTCTSWGDDDDDVKWESISCDEPPVSLQFLAALQIKVVSPKLLLNHLALRVLYCR